MGLSSAKTRLPPCTHSSPTRDAVVGLTTEATGLTAGEVFGAARDWAWQKDAERKTCAGVSLDAASAPQQGPVASKVEGRMRRWRSLKPDPRGSRPRGRPLSQTTTHQLGTQAEHLSADGGLELGGGAW